MRVNSYPRYTYKKGNIYYFGRVVPSDLAHHYTKKRLVCSLRTSSFYEAKLRSHSIENELNKYWLSLRVKSDEHVFNRLVGSKSESKCINLTKAMEYYLKIKGVNKTKIFSNTAKRAVKQFINYKHNIPLDCITSLDVTGFRQFLLDQGLKVASVKRAFATLRAIINFVISEMGIDSKNPFNNVYLPESNDSTKRQPVPEGDIKIIQRKCKEVNDDVRWLVAFISDTGLRLAEASGLLKSDIHLDTSTPYIQVRTHPHRRLKTSSSVRSIPLTPLATWAIRNTLISDSKFCFPRYNKQDTTNANSASATINKWLKAANHNFVVHSLRHSFRDRLRKVETPTEMIDALGGWSINSVGQRYGNGYSVEHFKTYIDKISLTPG